VGIFLYAISDLCPNFVYVKNTKLQLWLVLCVNIITVITFIGSKIETLYVRMLISSTIMVSDLCPAQMDIAVLIKEYTHHCYDVFMAHDCEAV
jgi:hypothetical protein